MSEVTGIHQLVVRRRRDEQLPYPHGYDEFIGREPTGKIVLGYKIVDGVIVYEYAPTSEEQVWPKYEAPCELPIPNAATQAAMEEARELSAAFDARNVETTERFVIGFKWHYGSDTVTVPSMDDVEPTKEHMEKKYRGFSFSNWKVTRERVQSEDVTPWATHEAEVEEHLDLVDTPPDIHVPKIHKVEVEETAPVAVKTDIKREPRATKPLDPALVAAMEKRRMADVLRAEIAQREREISSAQQEIGFLKKKVWELCPEDFPT